MHRAATALPIALLGALIGLTGCVTGTRTITLPAATLAPAPPLPEIGSVEIRSVRDARAFEQKPRDPSTPSVRGKLDDVAPEARARLIGRQRNGYGKALGDIALAEGRTVEDEVRRLLVQGLEGRGIRVDDPGADGLPLDVTIDEFWAWFTPGMWVIRFEARLRTRLELTTTSGLRSVEVTGYGSNRGQVASDANWSLAYRRAFDDYVANLSKAIEEWTR
jgi:hypothetical protein